MADQTDRADRDVIARLTSEVVPALIERLAKSELGELEVREDGWRVRLRRPVAVDGEAQAGAAVPRQQQAKQVPVMAHSVTDGNAPRRETERGLITSPAVGYYASRDGVDVGTTVSRGDLVGHIDVLGVRQEVVATIDGTLSALDVEAGQAVEYGQTIGRVTPHVSERAVVDV
jgi:biotin carboxyl carrier protein